MSNKYVSFKNQETEGFELLVDLGDFDLYINEEDANEFKLVPHENVTPQRAKTACLSAVDAKNVKEAAWQIDNQEYTADNLEYWKEEAAKENNPEAAFEALSEYDQEADEALIKDFFGK